MIGSDHAPHTREEKDKTYPDTPSGMPGVQTLVTILLDHVNEGDLTLERFVDLTSAGAARIFGIAGKGRIARGYDADFTIVDLKLTRTIENNWIASSCGWTPFDGMKTKGWPVATILRGNDRHARWRFDRARPRCACPVRRNAQVNALTPRAEFGSPAARTAQPESPAMKSRFKAVQIRKEGDKQTVEDVELAPSDLMAGDVTVAVSHSTVNYKDGLVLTGRSPVVRKFPMIPGIDLAGTVEEFLEPRLQARRQSHPQRLRPQRNALWRLCRTCARQGRMAGSAAEGIHAGASHGDRHGRLHGDAERPRAGRRACDANERCHRRHRRSGRRRLGRGLAARQTRLPRDCLDRADRGERLPQGPGRGRNHSARRSCRANRVCSARNAGPAASTASAPRRSPTFWHRHPMAERSRLVVSRRGIDLPTSVAPFILRGISLLGIDSVQMPRPRRVQAWNRLARDLDVTKLAAMTKTIPLSGVRQAAEDILAGKVRGRLVVEI